MAQQNTSHSRKAGGAAEALNLLRPPKEKDPEATAERKALREAMVKFEADNEERIGTIGKCLGEFARIGDKRCGDTHEEFVNSFRRELGNSIELRAEADPMEFRYDLTVILLENPGSQIAITGFVSMGRVTCPSELQVTLPRSVNDHRLSDRSSIRSFHRNGLKPDELTSRLKTALDSLEGAMLRTAKRVAPKKRGA